MGLRTYLQKRRDRRALDARPPSDVVGLADRIDAHVSEWQQGDVIFLQQAFYVGRKDRVTTQHISQVAVQGDLALLLEQVEGLVLLTQTCDLVRCDRNPYVEMAPLVRLPEQEAKQGRERARPRYAHVPGLGTDAFADLGRVLCAEKAILLDYSRTRGCRTDQEIAAFASASGRIRSRFPFPDDLNVSLRSMNNRLSHKRGSSNTEGRAISELIEVLATPSPNWGAERIGVIVTFVVPPLAQSSLSESDWDSTVQTWSRKATPSGKIASVDGIFVPADQLTFEQYRQGYTLDLDRMSPYEDEEEDALGDG